LEASVILKLLRAVARMKAIPRSGWISHGVSVQDVESVADHMFSTIVLSMLLADMESKRGVSVDTGRTLRMAILHDLAEALTFDISKAYLEYMGKKGESIKKELEQSAWMHLMDAIHDPKLAKEYTRIQAEFNSTESIESEIVHAADRLDILLQAAEYSKKGYAFSLLKDLWTSTNRELKRTRIASARTIQNLFLEDMRKFTRR